MLQKFYSGYKLLNTRDINGNQPEIFISEGNRSAGKTTFFNSFLIREFKEQGKLFAVIVRNRNHLSNCAEKFFTKIQEIYFPDDTMESRSENRGSWDVLYLNKEKCGYVIPLSAANIVKNASHMLSSVDWMLFDEFQAEDNNYLPDEVNKLLSIHTSLARGVNQSVKYLPIIMIANKVSLINPYYLALGISEKLQQNTKTLKGNGFVLERFFNESVAEQHKTSLFNAAFSGTEYNAGLSEDIYLNDNQTFVEKMTGDSNYICTVYYKGKSFSIREFPKDEFIYCSRSVNEEYPVKIAIDIKSMTADNHFISLYPNLAKTLRFYFNRGLFRFEDIECKEVILNLFK